MYALLVKNQKVHDYQAIFIHFFQALIMQRMGLVGSFVEFSRLQKDGKLRIQMADAFDV